MQGMTGAFGLFIVWMFVSMLCLLIELVYKSCRNDNDERHIKIDDTDYLVVNISGRISKKKNEINCDLICKLCDELQAVMDNCT